MRRSVSCRGCRSTVRPCSPGSTASANSPAAAGGPRKQLLLLYALARLKNHRETDIRFNATEAIVAPLLGSSGPWGSGAQVSYRYGRLVNDGLWHLPDRTQLLDARATSAKASRVSGTRRPALRPMCDNSGGRSVAPTRLRVAAQHNGSPTARPCRLVVFLMAATGLGWS
jgi:hypothetical protein